MKTVACCFVMVLVLVSFSGCLTTDTAGLSSRSLSGITQTVNPALAEPEKGFHPYVSAAYSSKHDTTDREYSLEEHKSGTVTAGFNVHNSFEKRKAVLPYIGVALSGAYTSYDPDFMSTELTAIEAAGIPVDDTLYGYTAEMVLQPGMIFKISKVLMQVYLQGIITYDDGSYASLRHKIDGIENMYNLADNPWTFGYALGYEFQFGSSGTWDVGFFIDCYTYFNQTQSVSYHYIQNNENNTLLSPGGDHYSQISFRFGPFLDYRNFRGTLFINNDSSTLQIAWRF